ncbi:MAG: FadR family transcriptional regulator [Acidobacteriota bacterium]|nr:FadR family transcriptional regulator [Acidobacteriota bacterium]
MPEVEPNGLSRSIIPIDRVGATELVVQRIKELLQNGALKAGSRLPTERELAGMLGISRPTLRTALKALSVMGVINARPGAGTFIADSLPEIFSQPLHFMTLISNTGISDIFQARLIIEPGLAEVAAKNVSDAHLNAITREIQAMRDALGDIEKFLKHDLLFHQTISRAAGNELMSSIIDTILQLLFQLRGQKHTSEADLQEAIAWHERIYRALERRDGKRAKELMSSHLRTSRQHWQP